MRQLTAKQKEINTKRLRGLALEKSWASYKEWYRKVTKDGTDKTFTSQYTEAEYKKRYNLAQKAGIKNISRTLARKQRVWDRRFVKEYNKYFEADDQDYHDDDGNVLVIPELTGDMTSAQKASVFEVFVTINGGDYGKAREQFEGMYSKR